VSFSLYGPIFSVAKSTGTLKEVNIKAIGKYIYFHGALAGVKILDYSGTVIKDIKSTNDFARLWPLHLLRLNTTQGEHFFGYGDGNSPRCTPATGTCGAEFEKCTDDGTCNVMCPTPRYNCDQGNFGAPFYDAKTRLLFIDGHSAGARIYKYDPVNGYIDDWQIDTSDVIRPGAGILPYDETYFYLIYWYQDNPDKINLYRCRWDTLRYSWKATAYLKDSCELIASALDGAYERTTQTMPEQGGWHIAYNGYQNRAILKPDGTQTSITPSLNRYYATKYAVDREATSIDIYDLTTLTKIQTITLPYSYSGGGAFAQQSQPFVVLASDTSYYVYLLKYGNYVPILQYDPATRKFRVIDLITSNPITAKVKVWCSSIGYPSARFPLAITPTEMQISDWTSPPACSNGALTIEISDVVA